MPKMKQPSRWKALQPSPQSATHSPKKNEQAVQEANEILNKLRSMDIEIRMQAFQRLHIVAKVAGPKQTREELLPLLDELTDDIPKTLVVLAEQLGVLASMLGGTGHEHAHMVLRGLEVLVQGDELLVREQAASSIARVVCLLQKAHIGTHVMTMMDRLSEGAFFNSRLAGCLLVGQLYSKVSKEEQHVLLLMYVVKYCTDENPAVRREAVRQMSALCEVMEPELVKENMLPVVQKLPKDLQTSVRLLLPTACVAVSRAMRRGGNEVGGLTEVIEVMEVMAKDDAWRVRFTLATNYTELWTLVTPDEKQEDAMLASFVAFAHDTEPEVRCAAAKNLAGVARSLTRKDDAKQVLIEAVNFLQHNNSVFVRAALATVITSLAVLLSTTRVPEGLLPAILRLLKDDNPEVVLNVVGTLTADFNRIVGVHSLSTALLPSIKELATSRDWRNRMKLITHTPLIAGHLDRVLFSDHLSAICMDWLGDSVFSVRQAAAVNLAQLAQIFGAEWAKSFLIPKFISLSVHRSYIYRMMSLTAAKDMAPVVGKELATSHLLQVVLTLADDRVANVRVSVARTLSCLLPHLVPAAVHALAAPKLLLLLEDDDVH